MSLEDAVGSPFEEDGVMYYPVGLEKLGTVQRQAKAVMIEERGAVLAGMSWLTDEQRTEQMYAYQDQVNKEADLFAKGGLGEQMLDGYIKSLDGITFIISLSARGNAPVIPVSDIDKWGGLINRILRISGFDRKKAEPPNRAARRSKKK